jgi:hypothetical protein
MTNGRSVLTFWVNLANGSVFLYALEDFALRYRAPFSIFVAILSLLGSSACTMDFVLQDTDSSVHTDGETEDTAKDSLSDSGSGWETETDTSLIDYCPSDSQKTTPGVCGCGFPDWDGDGDGVPDCEDGCPKDTNKVARGVCGCGVPDDDDDSDSVLNCLDECPNDPDKTKEGECGCGVPEEVCVDPFFYEAEDYTSKGGCLLSSHVEGYSGKGFMVFSGKDSWLEWNNIDIKSAGSYVLEFRYSNAGANDRPCDVVVNGTQVNPGASFSPNASWTEWQVDSVQATLLASPTNVIRISATTEEGGPLLDSLRVSPLGGGGGGGTP